MIRAFSELLYIATTSSHDRRVNEAAKFKTLVYMDAFLPDATLLAAEIAPVFAEGNGDKLLKVITSDAFYGELNGKVEWKYFKPKDRSAIVALAFANAKPARRAMMKPVLVRELGDNGWDFRSDDYQCF